MKSHYTVVRGEESCEVVVESLADGAYRVQIGERELELSAFAVGERELQLQVGVDVHDLLLADAPGGAVTVHGREGDVTVELLDEERQARALRRGGAGMLADGKAAVIAPMPGKVVKALVAVGALVEEGQGVIVVEAMKMENELRAPMAGEVKEILVAQGESVDAGQMLVILE